jgi:protein O-GlcNAc transferase
MSDSKQQDPGAATPTPLDLVEQGRVLHRAGNLDAAAELYRRALEADADSAEAHQLLAVIAGQRGHFDEAIPGFRRTIALDGPTPTRLFNLAEAYRFAGDFDAALAAYSQALTIDAGFLDAYRNCADAAKETAALFVAQGNAEGADRLNKIAAHYLLGLGHACLRARKLAEAEPAYRQAIALAPDQAEAYNNLVHIALELSRPVEAEQLVRRALAIEPQSAAYASNLGTTLLNQVRLHEAADLFRCAIEIDPSFEGAQTTLRDNMLSWQHYRSDLPAEAVFANHREWGRGAMERAAKVAGTLAPFANRRDPDRKLRIGYLGLDDDPAIRHGFFEPLVAHHDRARFDPVVFALTTNLDARTQRLMKITGEWRRVGLRQAKDVAERMRSNQIDIAIDLAGHLEHGRLDIFALKPAPVCASWLGYPHTTGLPAIDYRITDDIADPAGAEELYTERLFRLTGGAFVFRPPEGAPEVSTLPARAAGAVTFGYFDDPRKISPETIQAWGSVLGALPHARLLLIAPQFADTAYASLLRDGLRAVGIEPARVQMRERSEVEEERPRAYSEIDAVLDSFPYNISRAMACESLWMGAPIVALSGDRPCTRLTASVLARVGLERLDSHTTSEYVETAIELAQDLERLHGLRSGMRERLRVSPLMDESAFARRFEAALRAMWRRWCHDRAWH